MKNSKRYLNLMLKLSSVLATMDITPTMIENLIYDHCTGEKYYSKFDKKKKSGKIRKIASPCYALKQIQQKLNEYFYRFPVHPALKAYIKDCEGAKETAATHQFTITTRDGHVLPRPPRWLLKMDLKDFFPSIQATTVGRVLRVHFLYDEENRQSLFNLGEKLNEKPAKLFNQFVDLMVWLIAGNGNLLQGAPTSPYLANLVWTESEIIEEMLSYLSDRKKDFNLAIYADDVSISFIERRYPKDAVKAIATIINRSECFRVNPEKTKFNRLKHGAHVVAGISISRDSAHKPRTGISQSYLNTLRGEIHRANEILTRCRWPSEETDGISAEVISGKINWVKSICGSKLPSKIKRPVERFEMLVNLNRNGK